MWPGGVKTTWQPVKVFSEKGACTVEFGLFVKDKLSSYEKRVSKRMYSL